MGDQGGGEVPMSPSFASSLGQLSVHSTSRRGLRSIPSAPSELRVPLMNFPASNDSLVSTGSVYRPICRFCHMISESTNKLIRPCRCSGTVQFIHQRCLMKWLELCAKRTRKPLRCELCNYQFQRHKKFKVRNWRMPRVGRRDKVLHVVFLLNLLIMVGCAVATIMCFLSDKGQITRFPRNRDKLTVEEVITLTCGVLFFVSFFVAMAVQIKAKCTVYQLVVKFFTHNMEWQIHEYDQSKDVRPAQKAQKV